MGRGERIRTSDILLPKTGDEIASAGSRLQTPRNARDRDGVTSSGSPKLGANSKNFAPILLPEQAPPTKDRHTGVQPAALLSVAEVARTLRVCEATVYKLCARGTLAHIRILNAVRVAPEALESYLSARRRG
jgi:excisionase family DNA binding protein